MRLHLFFTSGPTVSLCSINCWYFSSLACFDSVRAAPGRNGGALQSPSHPCTPCWPMPFVAVSDVCACPLSLALALKPCLCSSSLVRIRWGGRRPPDGSSHFSLSGISLRRFRGGGASVPEAEMDWLVPLTLHRRPARSLVCPSLKGQGFSSERSCFPFPAASLGPASEPLPFARTPRTPFASPGSISFHEVSSLPSSFCHGALYDTHLCMSRVVLPGLGPQFLPPPLLQPRPLSI